MTHKEINSVHEQLKLYNVPVAKLSYVSEGNPRQVRQSADVADILRQIYTPDMVELREVFTLILLNRGHQVKGLIEISRGGLSGTVIDTRLILASALLSLCPVIMIAHNHPSNNLKPSEADIQITKKIRDAAEMMEIKLLDHIIMGRTGHLSFADEGYI